MLPSLVFCGPPYGALPPTFENRSVGRGSATQLGIATEGVFGCPDFVSLKVDNKSIFSRPETH